MTGAVGGMVQDIGRGAKFVIEGEYGRAAEKLLPKAVGNIFTAIREIEGATTSRGDRVWDEHGQPYMPSTGETVKRGLGFRSARRAILAQTVWVSKREERRFKKTQSKIYKKVKFLTARPEDDKLKQDVADSISDYNRGALKTTNVPLITPSSIERQMTRMEQPTAKQKARTTRAGRATRFEGDIWAGVLGVTDQPDATQVEVKRLSDLGILRYSAPPSRTIDTGRGERVTLTDDQYTRYVSDTTTLIKQRTDALLRRDGWRSWTDKRKVYVIRKTINRTRRLVRDNLKRSLRSRK